VRRSIGRRVTRSDGRSRMRGHGTKTSRELAALILLGALGAAGCGDDTSSGVADGSVYDGPIEASGDARGLGDVQADSTLDSGIDGATSNAADGADAADGTSADGSEAGTDGAGDGPFGDAADASNNDSSFEAGAEASGDAAPDATVTDAAADASLEAAPDATLDAGADASPDSAPDASPDSAPDATLDAIADAIADAISDATGDAADAADALEAGPPCDTDANPCSGQLTCCSGSCVDLTRDPRNCGACGADCTADQFCTGTQCVAAIFANICDNPAATVILDRRAWGITGADAYGTDDLAGIAVGQALQATCGLEGGLLIVDELDSSVLAPETGAPNTGVGNTSVACGGGDGQHGVRYLDSMQETAIYLYTDGTTAWFTQRSTGVDIATVNIATQLTAHQDYFYLQMTVEPISGTLTMMGVGMFAPGTAAAGYYASTVVLPNRAAYTDSWYVYEWQDTDGDSTPSAGDTFTPLGQGN